LLGKEHARFQITQEIFAVPNTDERCFTGLELGFKRPMLLPPAGRYGYLSLPFGDKKARQAMPAAPRLKG
jgi:hypothetical protein